jgi:plastocyanin
MRSLAFTPAELAAAVGQTVIWRNDDTAAHNVTYVSGPRFVSSATMRTGASYRIKLTRAGTIQYYCTIHPFMTGTIAVLPR